MKKRSLLIVVVGLLVLPACALLSGGPAGETGPTLMPPPTPLLTPSPDPAAERAPAAAVILSPSPLPDPTSAPPKFGRGGLPSPTPAATGVPTLEPPAASPVPPATPAPTSIPAPTGESEAGPITVDYFQANVASAYPGDTITLAWSTSGAESVTLWRLMPSGQLGQFWDVPAAGSFEYQIAEHERNRSTFALAVTDAGGNTEMVTLAIDLPCPDTWFFGNPPDICPTQAALLSAGAEQHFQNGLMLWHQGEDRIYVLYGDGQQPEWAAFGDEWDPGEAESDPGLEAPLGFYQPVRGFGQLWREQPDVRQRLGWALGEEAAYQTALQRTSYAKYNETYIRALDGAVWRLLAERSGWEKIPG